MDDNEAKKYFNSLLERKMDSLDDKRKQIIRECFEGLLLNLFLESKDMVYQKFLKKEITASINDLEAFQSLVKCDIFVLDNKGLPITKNKIYKNQNNCVILLNDISTNKIEIIGKLLAGNKIMRKIESSDLLIKKIKACFDKSVLK